MEEHTRKSQQLGLRDLSFLKCLDNETKHLKAIELRLSRTGRRRLHRRRGPYCMAVEDVKTDAEHMR